MGDQGDNCAYCGRAAGRTETMYLWAGNIACRKCYEQRARGAATVPSAAAPDDAETIPRSDDQAAPRALPQTTLAAPPPVLPLSYGRPTMYSDRSAVATGISEAQINSATILMVLAILQFIGGTCIGVLALFVGGLAATHAVNGAAATVLGMAILAFAVFMVGVGITYLICRAKILEGSRTAAIVALVVASVHLLLHGASLINYLMRLIFGNGTGGIGLLISVVIIAAHVVLIANLAKFLKGGRTNANL